MHRFLFCLAALVAMIFIGVSATINGLFLASLGRTPMEAGLFAAVSLASDVAKAILPVVIARALVRRAWLHGGVAGGLLVLSVGLSLASGLGFAASGADRVAAAHRALAQRLAQTEGDLDETERRLGALGATRGIGVIETELQGQRVDRSWSSSRECADPTGPHERSFCAGVFRLRTELASARDAAALTARRDEAREALRLLRAQGAAEKTDPQAEALSQLLGLAPRQARLALMILVALVLEGGSVTVLLLLAGPAFQRRDGAPKPEPVKVVEPVAEGRDGKGNEVDGPVAPSGDGANLKEERTDGSEDRAAPPPRPRKRKAKEPSAAPPPAGLAPQADRAHWLKGREKAQATPRG